MGQETRELREQVEATRERLGEDVEALRYKTDVGARASDYVSDKKDAVLSKVTGRGSNGASRARRVDSMAHGNPIGLAIGGAAVGFIAGLLLPSTRMEDDRLGETADRVKDTAKELGGDALEHGKNVAQSAMETVREEGSKEGQELATELRDRVSPESDPQTTRVSTESRTQSSPPGNTPDAPTSRMSPG